MGQSYQLRQIISGGQTGVDRAALDVAIHLNIPHGGWCPRHRLAEDGPIPLRYALRETQETDYASRTEKNVLGSEGTLLFHFHDLTGGTKLTAQLARRHARELWLVDLADPPDPRETIEWLVAKRIGVLNVAGPRESTVRGIGRLAEAYLLRLLANPEFALQLGLPSDSELSPS